MPFSSSTAQASVFLFLATDCPICNRYAPEIKRLHDRFTARGVRFWRVYPDPDTTAGEIGKHTRDFDYRFPALRDPQHALVKYAGATVTPEAAIFDGGGRLIYRGRIDDRFPELGVERSAPTRRDLEAALVAALDGTLSTNRLTTAVGCYIAER